MQRFGAVTNQTKLRSQSDETRTVNVVHRGMYAVSGSGRCGRDPIPIRVGVCSPLGRWRSTQLGGSGCSPIPRHGITRIARNPARQWAHARCPQFLVGCDQPGSSASISRPVASIIDVDASSWSTAVFLR